MSLWRRCLTFPPTSPRSRKRSQSFTTRWLSSSCCTAQSSSRRKRALPRTNSKLGCFLLYSSFVYALMHTHGTYTCAVASQRRRAIEGLTSSDGRAIISSTDIVPSSGLSQLPDRVDLVVLGHLPHSVSACLFLFIPDFFAVSRS